MARFDLLENVPMAVDQGMSVPRGFKRRRNSFNAASDYQAFFEPDYHATLDKTDAVPNIWHDVYPTNRTTKVSCMGLFVVGSHVSQKKPSDWLEANGEVVNCYAGEWLLISIEGLVAHSTSYHQIRSVIQETRPTEYITYYVPRPDEANFKL